MRVGKARPGPSLVSARKKGKLGGKKAVAGCHSGRRQLEKEEAFEEAAKRKDRDSSVPSQQIGDGCSGEDVCRERVCVADRKGKRGEQRPGRGRGQVVGCVKREKKAEERVERQTTDTMARRRRRRKRLARSYCESAPVPLRLAAAAAGAASGAWPRLLTLRRNNTTPTRGINAPARDGYGEKKTGKSRPRPASE